MKYGLLGMAIASFAFGQWVQIRRDSFGTPYIFGKRDKDCAYGLAWAHAEDDFDRIQYLIALAKGKLGRIIGKSGAAADYFVHFCGAFELARVQYDSLSASIKEVLEGYAEGLNDFARKHSHMVRDRKIFPVFGEDILRGYIIVLSGMVGAAQALQRTMSGHPESHELRVSAGSNGIALSSRKTEDGGMYLLINPHVPLEGILRWYEAFLHSEEGWHILGGLFPGAVVPGLGTNPHLGWALTFNWPDFVDIYQLKVHPKNSNLYQIDGEWKAFERKPIKLEVRLMSSRSGNGVIFHPPKPRGPVVAVKKTLERSIFGPVVRTKNGVFAIRFAVERFYRAPQQWCEMSKARNFSEFRRALELQGIPLFNLVYADKYDTIYYLFNGLLPERNPKYNWQSILPGDTSATLWKRYLSVDQLPQVLSPRCGYVFSVNNSPFSTTCPEECPRPEHFPATHGWEWNRHNNREKRLYELLSPPKISWQEFQAIKYDRQYPKDGPIYKIWSSFASLPDTNAPNLREAQQLIRLWDFTGLGENRVAPLLMLSSTYSIKKSKITAKKRLEGASFSLPSNLLWEALRYAVSQLRRFYKRIDPPLSSVQAIEVKGIRYAFDGLPEQLAPTYAEWDAKKGFLRVLAGDTYIQFVRFSSSGSYPYIESVLPLGVLGNPANPYYDNQLPLYLFRRCKPMTLDPAQIQARTVLSREFILREK
ncbi:MAG: penicillin acylase family protein [Bacteroidia bacterium]|nr:penicillin acylase family protein [Bacteroidia bacterium]